MTLWSSGDTFGADPNRVSAPCWDGRHHRCTGWMVVEGRYDGGMSIACQCLTCLHPHVAPDRHLHVPPQKGHPWNSSTATP